MPKTKKKDQNPIIPKTDRVEIAYRIYLINDCQSVCNFLHLI